MDKALENFTGSTCQSLCTEVNFSPFLNLTGQIILMEMKQCILLIYIVGHNIFLNSPSISCRFRILEMPSMIQKAKEEIFVP